jgi:CubicO group peptidase (beta-lactamase class C family)
VKCLFILLLSTLATTQTDMKAWLGGRAAGFSGAVLIARGDAIEVQAAYGMATGGAPNTIDTRFNIGSINKTFTAIAIAQLIQKGRLSLDDPLAKHFPEYPNRDAAAKITIRDLITHRSGVAQFMGADFGDATVGQMARAVGAEPQVFEPRARQAYSNGGYIVLGRVIELVSGQPYAAYVGEHVYRPAGMTTGGAPGNPAGGGYFTATDLFRFARALRTGKLLDARMTEYVLNGTFSGEGTQKFGFALREQVIGTRRFIGNGGGAPGINAEFRLEPAGEYTVVVLANASPPAATQLLADILGQLRPASQVD